MSSLLKGVMIILTVLMVELIAGFIQNQTTTSGALANCGESFNDTVECQSVDTGSFLSSVFDVTVSGFDNAPDIINAIWLLATGTLLIVGVIMIIARFIPLLGGDG